LRKQKEIEVPSAHVRFLVEEVLGPLSLSQIGDLMGVTKGVVHLWMNEGIHSTAYGLPRYRALEQAIEKKGARAVMSGRIEPVGELGWKSSWRCAALIDRGGRYSRCQSRRLVGGRFCHKHADEIKHGAMYATSDGDVSGFWDGRGRRGDYNPELPERCRGISYGGFRCRFVGKLEDGLCRKHLAEMKKNGSIVVLNDRIAERYAR